jgi:hypothetical protein
LNDIQQRCSRLSKQGLKNAIRLGEMMKKFMFLHVGFEKPTPEIMAAWNTWFASVADKQVDQGGFVAGRELSKSGVRDLPWDMEAITGYNILEAESLSDAEKIAQSNPFIASIRIYELRSH